MGMGEEISEVLKSWTLEELLELNDITVEELLEFLVDTDMIVLPIV